MQDGLTARHSASYTDSKHHSNGVASNGGKSTPSQPFHSACNNPQTSASSSPVRKSSSLSSSPSHHFHAFTSSSSCCSSAPATCNGEFKLCGYDGVEEFGTGGNSTTSSATTPAEIFGVLGFWLKLRHDLTAVPWEQLRAIKMKNSRAAPGCAYIPTEVEHIANVITHGFWVLPSVYAWGHLLWRSSSPAQMLAAAIYGAALAMLFFVSTIFHCVFYCNRNRPLKDVLHRCDRAMIYIFIAGSYYPWLSLGHTSHPEIVSVVKWCVWLMAVLGIIYQQMFHERYKCLETFFYIVIGVGPSLVIVLWGHEFTGMAELKVGGFLYIIGIVFFKSDGIFPFAHAIWHLFVVLAATVHYFAILTYLYPVEVIAAT